MLGPFVNPCTADKKYSLLNGRNLLQHFQMQLPQKPKIFSNFFFTFLALHSSFKISTKNMTLIAEVYLNLLTLKYILK